MGHEAFDAPPTFHSPCSHGFVEVERSRSRSRSDLTIPAELSPQKQPYELAAGPSTPSLAGDSAQPSPASFLAPQEPYPWGLPASPRPSPFRRSPSPRPSPRPSQPTHSRSPSSPYPWGMPALPRSPRPDHSQPELPRLRSPSLISDTSSALGPSPATPKNFLPSPGVQFFEVPSSTPTYSTTASSPSLIFEIHFTPPTIKSPTQQTVSWQVKSPKPHEAYVGFEKPLPVVPIPGTRQHHVQKKDAIHHRATREQVTSMRKDSLGLGISTEAHTTPQITTATATDVVPQKAEVEGYYTCPDSPSTKFHFVPKASPASSLKSPTGILAVAKATKRASAERAEPRENVLNKLSRIVGCGSNEKSRPEVLEAERNLDRKSCAAQATKQHDRRDARDWSVERVPTMHWTEL